MTLENNPSHEQFARWFLIQPEVIGEIKLWFGKEFVNLVAEIDEDEKRVYLKDCEKCELLKIIHTDLNSPTCTILKCTDASRTTVQNILDASTLAVLGAHSSSGSVST